MFQGLCNDTSSPARNLAVVAVLVGLAIAPLFGLVQQLSELDETLPEVVAAVSQDTISRANCAIIS